MTAIGIGGVYVFGRETFKFLEVGVPVWMIDLKIGLKIVIGFILPSGGNVERELVESQ